MTRTDRKAEGAAAEALAEYRRRRDFVRTAEPAGGDPAPSAGSPQRPVFVVQKHAASSLHYDFRLELEGVLRSWAIPKGPSLDPADKRLAVMTEDHPLEYAGFEGTIPEDQYGGGAVLLWDFGWWEPDIVWMQAAKGGAPTDTTVALAKGDLKFILHGQKLTGSWALVQMKGRGEKNWLLIKHRDDAARPGARIVDEAPESVATGRSLEQISADEAGPAAAAKLPGPGRGGVDAADQGG
jgi:bifunctional non-homologous end joining protein LigD